MSPLPTLEFCEQLFAHGLLTAQPYPSANSAEQSAVHELIRQADHLARLDAPSIVPELDVDAAQWGLSLLSWSVSLLVDRANASTTLPAELAKTEPSGQLACHHWSVDLALRYLGDVLLRAKTAASEDALVVELVNICTRWPMSSVGTQVEWNEQRGQLILDNDCLRRLLLDRIIDRRDKKLSEVPTIKRYIENMAHPPLR